LQEDCQEVEQDRGREEEEQTKDLCEVVKGQGNGYTKSNQVQISSTFYAQIFGMKVLCAAFL